MPNDDVKFITLYYGYKTATKFMVVAVIDKYRAYRWWELADYIGNSQGNEMLENLSSKHCHCSLHFVNWYAKLFK